MRIKLEDVALRAGLSKATVSLALNGSERINEKTRVRIAQIAREMGYHPNPYARGLATRKSRQIGLVIPDIENVYYASLAHHILAGLTPNGYGLSISVSMNSTRLEEKAIDDMIDARMDGVLLAPVNVPNDRREHLMRLQDGHIPLLFVTSRYHDFDAPYVMCDLYGGMRSMLEALFGRGYRRIALLSGPEDVYCLDLRTDGYLDFIREKHLEYARVIRLRDVNYQEAQKCISECGTMGADAIVCVNDMIALGVINALHEAGVSVPGDVAVCGYDDVIFSTVSPVPVTTVRQNVPGIARSAVGSILKMVGDAPGLIEDKLLPCEIIDRQSVL